MKCAYVGLILREFKEIESVVTYRLLIHDGDQNGTRMNSSIYHVHLCKKFVHQRQSYIKNNALYYNIISIFLQ
jgi:hypothetical protein